MSLLNRNFALLFLISLISTFVYSQDGGVLKARATNYAHRLKQANGEEWEWIRSKDFSYMDDNIINSSFLIYKIDD